MSRIFLFVYDFFAGRKPLLYGSTIAVFAVSLFFISQIRFEEDITQFIPDDGEMKTSNAVFRNIKVRDRLVVHLSLTDSTAQPQPDLLIGYCDSLAAHLSTLGSGCIQDIVTRVSDDMMDEVYHLTYENLPVFLQEDDYAVIDSMLSRKAIDEQLQRNYNTLTSPDGFAMRRFIAADPLGINFLALKHLQRMQPGGRIGSFRQHFFTSDHKHLLFFIVPASSGTETANNAKIVENLDEGIARLQVRFPEVKAEYFGGPAVSVCNARQIKRDTMITLNIALLVIVIFTIIIFRSKRSPLLMLLPVLFGAAVSLMVLYFIKGSVSSITVGAGSVVMGIALNYSIHVMSHFRHAASPREVVAGLASPLTLGSFTTVGAFLGLTFAKSQALADFGLFSAFSLTGSALFCLIVLPHLLPSDQRKKNGNSRVFTAIERIASFQPEKQRVLLILMAVVTIVCLFFTGHANSDSDMMHLNYVDKKLQQAEQNLNAITSDDSVQTVYLVSTGRNLQEAEENHLQNLNIIRQLQQKGTVISYASADALLVPEKEQQSRIARWNAFWTEEKVSELRRNMMEAGAGYRFNERAFEPFIGLLDNEYRPVNVADSTWVGQGMLSEWLTQTDGLSMVMCRIQVADAQKARVYECLDGIQNLVILDRSYFASRFVHIISDDFYLILFISSFIVFFALWITYGRIELTLMTFTPMALSWIWITGIMGIFGLSFNIVSIIISTFIFGLGDDYSIFITDGLKDEYRNGRKTLPMHKAAIFMSAFAMIVGIGVLIFARHPALKSIATVSVIGMLAVVLAAYTVQPFLFRWFISGRTARGKYPYTLYSLLSSVFVFVYFGAGSILLSFLSLLLKIIPFPARKKKYCLHWLMSKLAKSTLYIYPPVKKKFLNTAHEKFSQPAVIIANHQSFLDILSILSLHPKTVMLVNHWVWHSPFFGLLVRNAGFYHVTDGVENSVETLRSMVAGGYSIAVFPEGSRSTDNKMKRFHNGAFYIANQLGLDILPVVLYGTGMVMPKTDPFNVRRGWLVADILPRIGNQQLSENTDRENAQIAARLMRDHYAAMEQRYNIPENPYFKNRLITNFIYKGPVTEWYLRVKLRMERNYNMFHKLIPHRAVITDLGCGYGFLAYMLAFLSEERTITGIDYDEDKIETASHCFSANEQLRFIAANATDCPLAESDVFILNDMLHYLEPQQQQQLLSRCVAQLRPGGFIIIRDADRNMNKAHRLTRLTEFFSTRLLQFNKTENELYFLSDNDIRKFAAQHGLDVESENNDRYTSNVVYILKKAGL